MAIVLVAACAGGPTPVPTTAAPTGTPAITPSATVSPGPTASLPPAGTVELARSDVPRPVVDPARATVAAEAVNAFGLELYRRIAAEPGNIVISPASIAIALSMARAGALGTTADEMDRVLHGLGSDELGDAINALDAALASRSGTFKDTGGVDQEVALRIANALFSQHDMSLQQAFLDAMASRYGAGVWLVDYAADPEGARQAINAWVAEHTEARIPEILRPGQVTGATRLALANAIYLKAAWRSPFAEDQTAPGSFNRAGAPAVEVPMMWLHGHLGYATGDGWAAVQLPYVGDQLAMTVIVPDDLAAFEARLDAELLGSVVDGLEITNLNLTMPSFDTESRAELSALLAALGMPSAFDPGAADFSGITTEVALVIGFVIHQANITVDEAGTEAAAATVVGFDTSGGGPAPLDVRVDRPFIFVLRDVPTGAVVFMGRVADPSTTR